MPARFLLMSNKTGQMGNRLVVCAHLLGAAYERGWTLLNPALCEYAADFVGFSHRLLVPGVGGGRAPWMWQRQAAFCGGRVLWATAYVVHRLPTTPMGWSKAANTMHEDLEPIMDRAEAGGVRLVAFQNYHFRQHAWCARHGERIRALLTPIERHRLPAEQVVAGLRRDAELVVGVHIRHGDYRTHLGGRFFYEVPVYARLMADVAACHPGRRIAFLVCGNGRFTAADFPGLRVALGPGHLVQDLHALSRCDLVMGPPSSFSSWAAFHGQARYWMIEDPTQTASPERFIPQPSPDPRW